MSSIWAWRSSRSTCLVPLYDAGGDFVSAWVANYQFSPTGSVLFDEMWVQ
jgi:hypothetical protein